MSDDLKPTFDFKRNAPDERLPNDCANLRLVVFERKIQMPTAVHAFEVGDFTTNQNFANFVAEGVTNFARDLANRPHFGAHARSFKLII